MKKTVSMLKDESGIALMIAIFTVTVLMIIATEVMYETNVELIVSSQAVNQLKAHYAAKSGVQISLLRIQIYRKAAAMVGNAVPASTLDPIWQTPFAWPPVVPDETSIADKEQIKKAVKASSMQGTYFTTIESEGGKIDVNDLDSPSKVVQDSTRQQILEIFTGQMENDQAFGDRFRGYDFGKLVDNLTDWIDADKTSKSGGSGDEGSMYPDRPNENIPPNAPFKTLEELHMVAGMTDELFDLLSSRLTVFGTKGINVNYAKKDVLMSLSPQITPERADKIIEDRGKKERGPFKDEDDFVQYLGTQGITGNPFRENNVLKVPLLFDPEFNFRIRSRGQAGRVQRDITAIVYDTGKVTSRLQKFLADQKKDEQAKAGGTQGQSPDPQAGIGTTSPAAPASAAKKKDDDKTASPDTAPNIVYWNEN